MGNWFHADVIEWIFLGVVLLALGYASQIRRNAVLDYNNRQGNGGQEILGRGGRHRTMLMILAKSWFVAAGIASVLMPPPGAIGDSPTTLNDQAIVFRLLILGGVTMLMLKLRGEQKTRNEYNRYLAKPDKRATDTLEPAAVLSAVEPPDNAA